jgi:hypothetical protein
LCFALLSREDALQLPKAAPETTFHTEKQTMKEPFTIERLQKETKMHDVVLKKYERPMNHTHLLSPFCLKNWVHMKSYISFKSKHMYVSRIKNA